MKGIRRIFLNRESDIIIIIIIDKIIQRSGRNVLGNIHSSTRRKGEMVGTICWEML